LLPLNKDPILFTYTEEEAPPANTVPHHHTDRLPIKGGMQMEYPDLNSYGYVSGRAATEQDVMEGKAAFILKCGEDELGTPLDIDVPQYAIHVDPYSLEETPGVIIQAEEANEQQLVGFIPFNSEVPITTALQEFRLLGRSKPAN
jgi:hypothetical protein